MAGYARMDALTVGRGAAVAESTVDEKAPSVGYRRHRVRQDQRTFSPLGRRKEEWKSRHRAGAGRPFKVGTLVAVGSRISPQEPIV